MSVVIAERKLDYFAVSGVQPGIVQIFAPEDEGANWRCRYRIEWPGFNRAFGMAGVDSLQALTLALQIIPVEIQVTEDFKAGRIGQHGSPIANVADLNKAVGTIPVQGFEQ